MSKKVIKVALTTQSIENAIKEIAEYKKWLLEKSNEFVKALAEEGVEIANLTFHSADTEYAGTNDVVVTMEPSNDNTVAVVATGNATLFIEFGTGVSTPNDHPYALQNGMMRGEYGYKLGRLENGWRYNGDPGNAGTVITEGKHIGMVHTKGNRANMCMYNTVKELQLRIEDIARRVFV